MAEDGYDPDSLADMWRNPDIDKSEPYVGELLRTQLRRGPLDLTGTHLAGIHLEHADLTGVDLSGADLRDAKLSGADLSNATLRGCILRRANMQGANLGGADLQGCDLTKAHCGGANLVDCNLSYARIEDTILLGTDLNQADLTGATIMSFTWNRLTRFSGIVGFDPEVEPDDEMATARFAAPLAMGEHDVSHSRRSSVTSADPSLSQTHIYRAPGFGSSGARPATPDPSEAATLITQSPADGTTAPAQNAKRTAKLWPLLVAALTLLAIGGWWQALSAPAKGDGEGPPPEPTADQPPTMVNTSAIEAELRSYRARIASLTARIDSLDKHNQGLQAHLTRAQADMREVQLQNRWLRTRHDETTGLREKSDLCETALVREREHNQRLEDTARILARGVTSLRDENESIKGEVFSQVQNIARLEDLTAQVDKLRRQLKAREEHLEALQLRNDQLERDLGEADQALAGIHRRIQGTALEDLLADDANDAPLVAIARGRTITFGGDYLLTLTVDAGELPGTVSTRLVLQAPPDEHIPEMNLILYGDGGKPIRKLAVSFPDNRHTGGFASVDATISSQQFPSAARLVLAPSLEGPALIGKAE